MGYVHPSALALVAKCAARAVMDPERRRGLRSQRGVVVAVRRGRVLRRAPFVVPVMRRLSSRTLVGRIRPARSECCRRHHRRAHRRQRRHRRLRATAVAFQPVLAGSGCGAADPAWLATPGRVVFPVGAASPLARLLLPHPIRRAEPRARSDMALADHPLGAVGHCPQAKPPSPRAGSSMPVGCPSRSTSCTSSSS